MNNIALICLFLWLSLLISSSDCESPPTCDSTGVPLNIYQAVKDSLTDIQQVLDDAQDSIQEKQTSLFSEIIKINHRTGYGGPFGEQLSVVSSWYNQFLSFIDNIATQVSIQMTQLYLEAINKIAILLKHLLKTGRTARTVKLLKFVCFEIAPKIGEVTAANKVRYWDIYEWGARRLVHLHTNDETEVYEARLDYIMNYSVVTIKGYTSEVGDLVTQFSAEVADKLLDIVREALNKSIAKVGSTVEPWVNDDKLEL